jgi:predicted nucleic acid-binding protein
LKAGPKAFLDTNVLVYAFTTDRRAEVAKELLGRGCVTSVQGLNEFANVARRKLGMSWAELRDALTVIRTLCHAILPQDLAIHEQAIDIAERYGLSMFDSLMVASALRGGCEILYSEDMQDGMAIDGRLRIVDPFRER